MRQELTDKLARAAAVDHANRHMRAHGRTSWNVDDWNVAADKLGELMRAATRPVGKEPIAKALLVAALIVAPIAAHATYFPCEQYHVLLWQDYPDTSEVVYETVVYFDPGKPNVYEINPVGFGQPRTTYEIPKSFVEDYYLNLTTCDLFIRYDADGIMRSVFEP